MYAIIGVTSAFLSLLSGSANSNETPDINTFAVDQYDVAGPNPLSGRRTDAILSRYIGPAITLDGLRLASSDLEQAIRKTGYAFYQVIIPAQDLDNNIVTLEVVPVQLGNTVISGNQYHSEENIRRSLPGLIEGESPSTKKLQRSLAISNLNPSKQAQVFFSAEPEIGLEARISVQDQRTQNGLIWVNDTGSEETGDTRIGVAYQNNNLFDKDHTVTLSFATSPEQSGDVQQYSAAYQAPFYNIGGKLNLYAIRSDVDTGTVATFFNVSGRGDFLGGDFTYALPNAGRYRQFLVIGLDDKLFENDIDFEGQPIGVNVRARPVSIRHKGNWQDGNNSRNTYIGFSSNIESGSNNDELRYAATRAGATPSWSALRFGGSTRNAVKTWEILGRFNAQYTNDALIPGEQFGVGGMNSLRGINERQLSADTGFLLSGEIMSPPIATNAPRVLMFVDGSSVRNVETLPGEVQSETVASVGAGLRWGWKRRLRFSLDYGYVVDGGKSQGITGIEDGDGRFHFQILGRI
jgi:hemolysin activation/secretion protein